MPQTMVTGGFLYLTAKLSPGGSSFIGDRDLGITKGRLKMRDPNNPDSTYTEWIEFGSVTAVGDGTFTYGSLVRQLSQTSDPATSLGTGNTWVAGTEAKLVAMHDQLADRLNGVLVPVYATTVARDAAITAPVNGMSCYVTADGVFYDYQGGAWATRGNGTTANASTTVAGKVEIATAAEVTAGTATGGTGAILAVSPDQLIQEINGATTKGSVVAADKFAISDSADSGKRKAVSVTDIKASAALSATTSVQGFATTAQQTDMNTGTDAQKYVTPALAAYTLKTPNTAYMQVLSAYAPTSRNSTPNTVVYEKKKEVTAITTATYSIVFTLASGGGGNAVYGQVYKNGVAFGTEQMTGTSGTYTESLAFSAGDLIQLYTKTNGSTTSTVSEFKAILSVIPNSLVSTVNTD